MVVNEIPEFKELVEIKKNQKKYKKFKTKDQRLLYRIGKHLFNFYQTMKNSNIEPFYNLIGQMIDDHLYVGFAAYFKFRDMWSTESREEFYNNFENIDKTILERYFLSSGEQVIKTILGWISLKKETLQGSIWLTNNRLLFIGKPLKYVVGPQTYPTIALVENYTSQQPNSKRTFECDMLQVPIQNPANIKRAKSSFSYDTYLIYKKKDKEKYKKLHISIDPLKYMKENKDHYKIRREGILQILEKSIT